ncbi:unnamed protein product [Protopolystoma xenopodis]|uniref:MIF4G domain-containing protein n=1 Tax=Protopolystoma xenopodis TaxID=117903 RepID=A0A3S5CPF6_9PLAT|nr:unnamed protein product [Protopolystoma xenopodis]
MKSSDRPQPNLAKNFQPQTHSEDDSVEIKKPHLKDSDQEVVQSVPDLDQEPKLEPIRGRKMYSRALMLEFKINPDGQNRNRGTAPGRVINLNANMAPVKGVEGAFKPGYLKAAKGDVEADTSKLLRRKINIILNRLTDSNMLDIHKEIIELCIKSQEELDILASLVFEKAIGQAKFCKLFAKLARRLKDVCIEIEKKTNDELNAKIEAAQDSSVKKMLEAERENLVNKKRDAYMCNMQFVGELYLIGFIPDRSVRCSLHNFFEHMSETMFEAFLVFVSTIGPRFDETSKDYLTEIMNKVERIIKNIKISSHLHFRLKELKELRARGWQEEFNRPLDSLHSSNQSDQVVSRRASHVEKTPLKQPLSESTGRFNPFSLLFHETNNMLIFFHL